VTWQVRAGSGGGCLAAGALSDLFPLAAGLAAAQGDDGVGSGDGPSHAGEIPGLVVHLPKGAYVTDADGRPVHRLGITAIPVARTPIPMPVDEQVPVYFTVQPAGGHITSGWATIDYPNYRHAAPGAAVDFWHYDVHGAGWGIYGPGTVDKAGTQVTPSRGTWVRAARGLHHVAG
jgi:hypothetical protein